MLSCIPTVYFYIRDEIVVISQLYKFKKSTAVISPATLKFYFKNDHFCTMSLQANLATEDFVPVVWPTKAQENVNLHEILNLIPI